MRIAIGCDHAGFPLKRCVVEEVRRLGHEPVDCGTNSSEPVDYPDFARRVGEAVVAGTADRGIIVCGSGAGASIAANKMFGIRAATCHDTYSAHQAVEHDDMNVLALGARVIGEELAIEIVRSFLGASFSGEERHSRRVGKIKELEAKYQRSPG